MIKGENICKSFGKQEVLKNININVEEGSLYGLLGINGTGKSTLLRILSGAYKADKGKVLVRGKEIFENPVSKDIVFLMGDVPFAFNQYSIKDMANFYKGIYKNFSMQRFEELQNVFKLPLNKNISSFSKGMQRQAAFWLALSIMPKVLMLDEPFDGLDVIIREKVKKLIINDVNDRSMTVIISSHNLKEIEDLCDHIGVICNGKMLFERDTDSFKEGIHKIQLSMGEEDYANLKNSIKIISEEKLGKVYRIIVKGDQEQVLNEINKFNPILMDIVPLTLEEVFISEMGGYEDEFKKLLS